LDFLWATRLIGVLRIGAFLHSLDIIVLVFHGTAGFYLTA
jgi:hypothetical protein